MRQPRPHTSKHVKTSIRKEQAFPRTASLEPLEIRILFSTFTVTNSNDSGPGSLRQAILAANAAGGPDTISFAIGSGQQTIGPVSPLPSLSTQITIDGTTQPGYAGVPLIQLNGLVAGSGTNGLIVSAANCSITGLIINRFGGDGIKVQGAAQCIIQGNYIGVDKTGVFGLGNHGNGINLVNASQAQIGGTTAASRNVISGNGGAGILSQLGSRNVIQGNYVGINAPGTTRVANSVRGIDLESSPSNMIGGIAAGTGNVISGNTGAGVYIAGGVGSGNNAVAGNLIGLNAAGTAALGNSAQGVYLAAGGNTVGGLTAPEGNVISGNGAEGVLIVSNNNLIEHNSIGVTAAGNPLGNAGSGVSVTTTAGPASGNAILTNSIFDNGGLGIDLGGDGVTLNDPGDTDTGANGLQNTPFINSAVFAGGVTTVQGTLSSMAGWDFLLEVFASPAPDASGFGQGKTLIYSTRFPHRIGRQRYLHRADSIRSDRAVPRRDGDRSAEQHLGVLPGRAGNSTDRRCLGSRPSSLLQQQRVSTGTTLPPMPRMTAPSPLIRVPYSPARPRPSRTTPATRAGLERDHDGSGQPARWREP